MWGLLMIRLVTTVKIESQQWSGMVDHDSEVFGKGLEFSKIS